MTERIAYLRQEVKSGQQLSRRSKQQLKQCKKEVAKRLDAFVFYAEDRIVVPKAIQEEFLVAIWHIFKLNERLPDSIKIHSLYRLFTVIFDFQVGQTTIDRLFYKNKAKKA